MKKDTRKLVVSIIALLLTLGMLLGFVGMIAPLTGSAAQKSSSQIKQEIKELEAERKEMNEQIAELQAQVDDNMEDMKAVVEHKTLLEQEIFLLYNQLSTINAQITAYGELIAEKQAELDQAQAELDELKTKNKARLRAMEKNSSITYWNVIFQADSFLDLLDRFKMIQEIDRADKLLMKQMTEATEKVISAKEELEDEKAGLEETKKSLVETQETLEDKRAEADALLAELIAKGEDYEALVEEAEAAKAELQGQINEKESEYNKAKDREYQEWLASQPAAKPPSYSAGSSGTANTVGGITWLVPCNYTNFASAYGMRLHPIEKVWKMHHGVDLGGVTGTPIIASRAGTVTVATYNWSAGYYVVVNHGDGYTSHYMHMTHYIVSYGQKVEAGQILGYMGSTGASTGPHLHFGIYYNGSSVNPANYIAI